MNDEPYPRKAVPCPSGKTLDEQGAAYGQLMTSPEFAAYRVIDKANPAAFQKDIDAPGLLATLRSQSEAVNRGDMGQAEAMLINQAVALQSLFTHLTERSLAQSQMPNLEAFMKLSLRAQSQCRATLETLATIKNPPIVYARQANITSGPQQVNNGVASQALENLIEPTQLLKGEHGTRMDIGTTSTAISGNPQMEALGKGDRPNYHRRKSAISNERL